MFSFIYYSLYGLYSKLYSILCIKQKDKCSLITGIRKYDKNLKLMSYNIDGLFCHYNNENYKNIANLIRNKFLNDEINVLCLQEVWEYSIYKLIIDKISDLNLYISQPPTQLKYYVGEHTGLLFISRFPIIYQDFMKFNDLNFTCRMTNKGFHHIDIAYQGSIFTIINTHLQCSLGNYKYICQYQHIAKKQMEQIIKYCKKNNLIDALIVGDLNLDFIFMKRILNNKDNNLKLSYKIKDKTCDNNEQLDYVLSYNNLLCNKNVNYNVFTHLQFSDHFPIQLNII